MMTTGFPCPPDPAPGAGSGWAKLAALALAAGMFLAAPAVHAYWIVSGLSDIEADGIPDKIIVTLQTYTHSPLRAIGTPTTVGSYGVDYSQVADPANANPAIGLQQRVLFDPAALTLPFVGDLDVLEFTVNPTTAGLGVGFSGFVPMDISMDPQSPIQLYDNRYYVQFTVADAPASAISEPGSLALALLALVGLRAFPARRRRDYPTLMPASRMAVAS